MQEEWFLHTTLFAFWLLSEAIGCAILTLINLEHPISCANYAETSWQLGCDLFLSTFMELCRNVLQEAGCKDLGGNE